MPNVVSSGSAGTPHNSPHVNVNLLIHEVLCEKTTKEVDKDEIGIVGIPIVGEIKEERGKKILAGKAKKGNTLGPEKFKKGDVKRYSKCPVTNRELAWRGYLITDV